MTLLLTHFFGSMGTAAGETDGVTIPIGWIVIGVFIIWLKIR